MNLFPLQVKTRLQAANCAPTANPMTVSREIMRSDGVTGLWRGTNPAAARAALLTASQCVTYDVVKNSIRHYSAADDCLAVQVATGEKFQLRVCMRPVLRVKMLRFHIVNFTACRAAVSTSRYPPMHAAWLAPVVY